jgi:hypothetical protein
MARTKRTPVQSKYSKAPPYIQSTNEIDRSKIPPCADNFVPPLARRRAAYEAQKAAWEARNPDTYPRNRPEADCRHGAAARK